MQALRLHEVLARVVAWHNRHPLARRINASQVHSIGEVLLPFASAQALAAGEAAAQAGTDTPPALPAWRPRGLPVPAPAPASDSGEAGQPAAAPESSTAIHPPMAPVVSAVEEDDSVELEIDIDLHATDSAAVAVDSTAADSGDATAAPADTASSDPGEIDPAPEQRFDRPDWQDDAVPASPTVESLGTDLVDAPAHVPMDAAATQAEADPPHAPDHDADPAPPPPSGLHCAEAAAGPAPAHRPTRLRRLLLALRTAITGRQPGMPRLQAAFSRDFI